MKIETVKSYPELVARAIEIANEGRKKTIAVAAAQDVDVIDAVVSAEKDGFLNGILIGDKDKIVQLAEKNQIDVSKLQIVDEKEPIKATYKAAELASEGTAHAVMKGFVATSSLLKVILDKKLNLRGKETLSHCAVMDVPGYHKLLNLTDGGMVVSPTPDQKLGILENALLVSKALGIDPIKVAVSGPTTDVSERFPHTVTDSEYVIPKARKMFKEILIDGPLPLDFATVRKAVEHRKLNSPVAGDADIMLMSSIEECNIMAKTLINFASAIFAGIIVGAKIPVSLVSRTDTAKNKKASLAIACLLADYYQQNKIWDGGNV